MLLMPAMAEGERVEEAHAAIAVFVETDPSLAKEIEKAAGYAVFNSVGKGGIGGARGKGVVFEAGNPVGYATLTQVSIGFQLGARFTAN